MDNLFTSLPLLENIVEVGIYGIGTIRENKLQVTPLKKKIDLQSKPEDLLFLHLMVKIPLLPEVATKVVIIGKNHLSCSPVSPLM